MTPGFIGKMTSVLAYGQHPPNLPMHAVPGSLRPNLQVSIIEPMPSLASVTVRPLGFDCHVSGAPESCWASCRRFRVRIATIPLRGQLPRDRYGR